MTSPDYAALSECANFSNQIFMELLKNDDPVEGIMRLYDQTVNKRGFVLALATSLLVRHRQWQGAAT